MGLSAGKTSLTYLLQYSSMNKKVAISLIYGCIFAIIAALFTSTTHYYYNNGNTHEISKPDYYSGDYDNPWKEVKYNDAFILIGLIGGIGVGYLVADLFKKKPVKCINWLKDFWNSVKILTHGRQLIRQWDEVKNKLSVEELMDLNTLMDYYMTSNDEDAEGTILMLPGKIRPMAAKMRTFINANSNWLLEHGNLSEGKKFKIKDGQVVLDEEGTPVYDLALKETFEKSGYVVGCFCFFKNVLYDKVIKRSSLYFWEEIAPILGVVALFVLIIMAFAGIGVICDMTDSDHPFAGLSFFSWVEGILAVIGILSIVGIGLYKLVIFMITDE